MAGLRNSNSQNNRNNRMVSNKNKISRQSKSKKMSNNPKNGLYGNKNTKRNSKNNIYGKNNRTKSRKKDNSLSLLDNDFKKWLIGFGIFLGTWAVLYGGFNIWQNSTFSKVASIPTGETYYQYLTDEKNAKIAQERDTNVKDIANRLMDKEIGISTNGNKYARTGVFTKGLFIQKAVLDGNGVPVQSDFSGDDTGKYANFDLSDDAFKNIREDSFEEMKEKAQKDLSNEDNKQNQINNLKNDINKARQEQGELTRNQNKVKNLPDKKQTPNTTSTNQ